MKRTLPKAGLSLALVHKHVKMSVGKWIMETTCPHKHVQIPEDQNFFGPHFACHDHFQIRSISKNVYHIRKILWTNRFVCGQMDFRIH